MAYQVTALYDQESGEAPLKWGKNAVAEGEFSANAGRVMVDDVLCTPVSWTASEVVFVPVASSRPDGNYSVHFDNEPLVLAFVTHPQDQTISATAPINEYLHDFTTKQVGAWTHARASLATAPDESGVIQTYASGEPAWYRDQGLQLEDASTNEVTNGSDDFNAWDNAAGVVVTDAAGTSPDGTVNATSIGVPQGHSSYNYVRRIRFGDHTGDMCITTYIKHVDFPHAGLRMGDSGSRRCTYNLQTGANTYLPAGVTAYSESYPDGWYRFGALVDAATGSDASQNMTAFTFAHVDGWDDGGGGIFDGAPANALIWGCSAELKTFPTSYIPATAGATYTRSATSCSATFAELGAPLPAGGVTNDFCGQVVFTTRADAVEFNDGRVAMTLRNVSSTGSRFSIMRLDGVVRLEVITEAGSNANIDVLDIAMGGAPLAGDTLDCRFKASSTEGMTLWVNGAKTNNPAVVHGFTTVINRWDIGNDIWGTGRWDISCHKTRLVPEALSDEDIEEWD